MNIRTALRLVLFAGIGAIGAAIYEAHAFHGLQASRAHLQDELMGTRLRCQTSQRAQAYFKEKIERLKASQAAARKGAIDADLYRRAKARGEAAGALAKRKLKIIRRMNLELLVRPEFEKLGLSSAQWEKYAALAIEREDSLSDARSAAHEQGLAGNEYQAAVHAVVAEMDAQIRGVVGDQAYQQLQDFNGTLQLQREVQQLANNFIGTDLPLSGNQVNQMVQLLATNRSLLPGNEEGAFFVPESLVAQAQGILSPPQFAAWKRQQASNQLYHQQSTLSSGPVASVAAP